MSVPHEIVEAILMSTHSMFFYEIICFEFSLELSTHNIWFLWRNFAS